MRIASIVLAAVFAAPAWAQESGPPAAAEVPPPPPIIEGDEVEPEVTIIKRGEDKVEEYRVNGRLYMIKVTPPHGVPYYLVDRKGEGQLERMDTLEPGTSVPMWVLKRW
ncbi:MAG: DUF2782 domain-containing protein [Rhodocyclaceae bacterium]|nr:DUF2782 domain-containing protein [Rhodocyclaceae bacterium]